MTTSGEGPVPPPLPPSGPPPSPSQPPAAAPPAAPTPPPAAPGAPAPPAPPAYAAAPQPAAPYPTAPYPGSPYAGPPQPQPGGPYSGGPYSGGPYSGGPYSGGPYGGYPYAPPGPTGSQAMSIWALVLSFIWPIPLAPLVGLILGIVVLASHRRGHGKAVAAVVISAVGLLACVALIVLGVIGAASDDSGSSSGAHGVVAWRDLRVGDCFDQKDSPKVGQERSATDLTTVPCASAHQFEVYASFPLGGADATYPGDDQVRQQSQTDCATRLHTFLGTAPVRDLVVLNFHPLAVSWAAGQRTVTCAAGPATGTVTGSLRR